MPTSVRKAGTLSSRHEFHRLCSKWRPERKVHECRALLGRDDSPELGIWTMCRKLFANLCCAQALVMLTVSQNSAQWPNGSTARHQTGIPCSLEGQALTWSVARSECCLMIMSHGQWLGLRTSLQSFDVAKQSLAWINRELVLSTGGRGCKR